jgi:general secretion pathway protein D
MKTKILALVLALTGLELWAQTPPGMPAPNNTRRPLRYGNTNGPATKPIFTQPGVAGPAAAPAAAAQPEEIIAAGTINWTSADVNQVLEIYSQYVGRTLLRPANLPAGTIVLQTKTALTKTEVIQALQAVLALNGIALVNIGDKFVKVVPAAEAQGAGGAVDDTSATNLPNLGTYITHITQLHYVKPSVVIPLIQGFGKLQGNLFPIDDNGILVMRDYAENIKRMLEMIDRIDVSVPAEYISEVISIRYAEAADIASALNSLGGGGGSTVSFGSSPSAGSISGMRGGSTGTGLSGLGGGGGGGGGGYGGGIGGGAAGGTARPFGTTTGAGVNGTPTGGTTFQQRLQSIISRASGPGGGGGGGQDPIQVFGQTKIIADQRSNSLLVFATRQDMENIKHVISQLDVLLAQVLIESIIMDVGLGNEVNLGVSAAQRAAQYNNSDVIGGGIMNNGNNSFLNVIKSLTTNGNGNVVSKLSGGFPTNSTGGLSYFGSIGDMWDIAVHAAESDNNSSIIQRPRIQTSQAKPAQFFVGETVPYVNNTYNNSINGGYGGSSYSQLSVGVELDVTPFINPDGLVVMDISQEIDEISGYTSIDGNQVPNTIKRTLNTEIAVKNRDTVILGGFVRADKSHTKSGVPLLMDIPILGRLFTSSDDKKARTELMVMMRPTVLKTPEIAAAQTIREAQRLPGVSAAAADNADEERRLIDAERKKELKRAKGGKPADGFFNMRPEPDLETNSASGDFGSAGHPGASSAAPSVPADSAPLDSAAKQEKARAAVQQKMTEMDQQENPPAAPAQPQ